MESTNKKQPQFWINPNTRLRFPQFCLEWQSCDKSDLFAFCKMEHPRRRTYMAGTTCVHLVHSEDYSRLFVLYHEDQHFENLRLQKWLRENIRDTITARASIALPKRLHELEDKHKLYAQSVIVKKLRKGILGQCTFDNQIRLSPLIVIFPPALMDETILHEMAHIKHHHHRKSFWNYLSILLGSDAKEKKMLYDIAISKYWELYTFLMK